MAAEVTNQSLDELAAGIETVGQGRAVLGKVASFLSAGYTRAEDLPSSIFFSSADVRGQAVELLDYARANAERTYAQLGTELQRRLSDTERRKVAASMKAARNALALIEDAAGADYWPNFFDSLRTVVREVAGVAGEAVGGTLDVAGRGLGTLLLSFLKRSWPIVLLVLAVLAILAFVPRLRVVRRTIKIGGGA